MIARVFSLDDQHAFARFSADDNPVHVDPIAARRTLFGRPIVHGVHAVIWALEQMLATRRDGRIPHRLRVVFKKAVSVGEEVVLRCADGQESPSRVVLESGGGAAMRIRIEWGAPFARTSTTVADVEPEPAVCQPRSLDQCSGATGSVALSLPRSVAERFPALTAAVSPARLGALIATSRVVGMECPGLQSIFSELDVDFEADEGGLAELDWQVERADARVSLITIFAASPGFRARIRAFVRPTSRSQEAYAALRVQVESGEFSDQRALVVGGSRGLGEVSAKLLAAGGAHVLVGFRQGRADAERVVAEIVAGGGAAQALEFDVLAEKIPMLPGNPSITHLYYFATPPILVGGGATFHSPLFNTFVDFYVTGFLRVVDAVGGRSSLLEAVLYPSSILIDEVTPALAEYAAAKAAGEVACALLEQRHPGLRVARPRLPRLATDQTASVTGAPAPDPAAELLRHLRGLATRADVR